MTRRPDLRPASAPADAAPPEVDAPDQTDGPPPVSNDNPTEARVYLTARSTETYGPSGRFVDLTPQEAAEALLSGDLVEPDADQLARRI